MKHVELIVAKELAEKSCHLLYAEAIAIITLFLKSYASASAFLFRFGFN